MKKDSFDKSLFDKRMLPFFEKLFEDCYTKNNSFISWNEFDKNSFDVFDRNNLLFQNLYLSFEKSYKDNASFNPSVDFIFLLESFEIHNKVLICCNGDRMSDEDFVGFTIQSNSDLKNLRNELKHFELISVNQNDPTSKSNKKKKDRMISL